MSIQPSSNDEKRWFCPVASEPAEQQHLGSVKAVEDGHRTFRNKVKQMLGGTLPKRRVTTKDELLDQLRELSPEQLGNMAHGEMRTAEQQKQTYTEDRKHGSKKVGSAVQHFFKSFADFVEAYSGVAHLIRSAGAPYGEAAFETLSLLLIVVDNKATNDTTISDLMQDLATAFPRLDVLMDVYPSTTLEKCVATVYVSVIEFARQATDYFAKFSNRFFGAVAKPPSMGLAVIANTIKGHLAEVNNEAMIQLHASNKKILQQVEALEEQNSSLSNSVNSLRASSSRVEDGNFRLEEQNATLRQELRAMRLQVQLQAEADRHGRLEGLASTLGLEGQPDKWAETDLDGVYETLVQVFPGCSGSLSHLSTRHHAAHFEHMTAQKFLADQSVQTWQSSPESALLFLHGMTEREGRRSLQQSCCWLSPGAVFMANHVASAESRASRHASSSSNLGLYYCCHPTPYSSGVADHDIIRLFSTLAWSICKWSPVELLTEEIATRARQAVHSSFDKTKRERIKILTAFIMRLLETPGLNSSATLWLIIDRPDVCNLDLYHILNQLVRLLDIHPAAPRVKILIVSDLGYPGMRWEREDVDERFRKFVILNEWNQRRTTAVQRTLERISGVEENVTAVADR